MDNPKHKGRDIKGWWNKYRGACGTIERISTELATVRGVAAQHLLEQFRTDQSVAMSPLWRACFPMKNDFLVNGDETVIFLQVKGGVRLETVIDTEDLPAVSKYPCTWRARWSNGSKTHYVGTGGIRLQDGTRGTVLLHRIVTECPKNLEVDHLFHDGLDNRKASLRATTCLENQFNRRGAHRDSKTGLRGVTYHADMNDYEARVNRDKKRYYLGRYDTAEEAGRVAREFRISLGGSNAA